MIKSVLSLAFVFLASAQAQAAVLTENILVSPITVPANQMRTVQLNLGRPVRILSMKVQATALNAAVKTEIFVAGLNVGTIAIPARRDPVFAAGGSPDPTSSIDFTSYGGSVLISQISVVYEVPEVLPSPVLAAEYFPSYTPILRPLDRSSLTAYCGDFAIFVLETMTPFMSGRERDDNLMDIKWKANELKTLAKVYGPGHGAVLDAAKALIMAIEEKKAFFTEKSYMSAFWPYVTDLWTVQTQLSAITGYHVRPSNLRKGTSL